MGSYLLWVWTRILGGVKVEALGHIVDPCSKAQMGLGIKGLYISPPLIRVRLLRMNQGTEKAPVTRTTQQAHFGTVLEIN